MPLSVPRRGDVYLVALDPERGEEIHAARPCVIVSPDELNQHLETYIVAPVTTERPGEGGERRGAPHSGASGRASTNDERADPPVDAPFRVPCRVDQKDGYVVLDQLRTVDKPRLVRRLTGLSGSTLDRVMDALREMFAD